MMPSPDAIAGMLAVAAVHRQRVQAAMDHLHPWLPLTADALMRADYEVIASAELLVSRFAKLQDHLGAKLVPLAIALAEEPLPVNASFVDKLQCLERLRALPDAAAFRQLREVRNDLAHDYPDDPDQAAAALTVVVASVPSLFAAEEALRAAVLRYAVR